MSKYLEQFSDAYDVVNPAPVRRAVIIASSQRCGSSLLGHTLGATGGFGVPLEYFNQPNIKHWKARFGTDDIADLLDLIEKRRTTSNGIFAIKCHYFQLNEVGSIKGLFTRYEDCRFIAIKRKDLLRQAISRTIALQTGVWFSGQQPKDEPVYDATQISRNMRILLRQRMQWDMAFAIAGVKPFEVWYEDLIADPIGMVTRIADYCDVDPEALTLDKEPPVRGQTTPLSREWVEKFRLEQSEEEEAILNGYMPPDLAAADLARANIYRFGLRRKAKIRWYRSPNLAIAGS